MTKINKEDLEFLSAAQIKEFYTTENISDYNISPIVEYIEGGRINNTMGDRINEIEKLLNIIVVERFIEGTL